MRFNLKKNMNGASIRVCLGVCAFNEEKNIGQLLENITTRQNLPGNFGVMVVCSGCTDSTPEIVRQFQKSNANVELVTENNRGGKARALNRIFKHASNSDILLLTNADAFPESGSLMKVSELMRDEGVGAVSGRPVPLNSGRGLAGMIVELIWELHHEVSVHKSVKLSGELCAIRPSLVKSIPTNLATDEPYIEMLIRRQGYRVVYAPDAVVRIRCPENLGDVFKHRRRIWAGHLQIKHSSGFTVGTSDFGKILPVLFRSLGSMFRRLHVLVLFVAIDGFSYLLARKDLSRGKIPFIWELIGSTKD